MLLEIVKDFIQNTNSIDAEQEEINTSSSHVTQDNVLADLSNQDIYNTGAFFDDDYNGIYGSNIKSDILEKQKNKIMIYRNLAKTPDVNDALEEIINEILFTLNTKDTLIIDIDEENEKIKDAIIQAFEKIIKLINIKKNMYSIVKNSYIDGQLVLHCQYDKKNTKNGIKSLKMIEPVYLYFDKKTNTFKYNVKDNNFYNMSSVDKGQEYSPEEIIKADFGLYEDGINLSYLEYALKPANQLRTLEDLLIPMRFSRSISRRVFNVDIGDLPNTKGEQAMREMQSKFKYKKFYNTATGEVTNQQHITSMVEDYWFANRSGGKGTQVETLDETGNLGEINDILYFIKKLYKAMYIPSNRISVNPDEDNTFDYESTQVTKQDIKFFMFINRIRQVYTDVFKNLLKREIISTGIMSEENYNEYKDKIEIMFSSENAFIEKMNLDLFVQRLDIYGQTLEYQGKILPIEDILKDVFKLSEDEIKEKLQKIQKEEKDPLYAKFYQNDEDESNSW